MSYFRYILMYLTEQILIIEPTHNALSYSQLNSKKSDMRKTTKRNTEMVYGLLVFSHVTDSKGEDCVGVVPEVRQTQV